MLQVTVLMMNRKIIPGYVPGTMLIKRASFSQAGKFFYPMEGGKFIDWYLRAVELGLKSFSRASRAFNEENS